MTFKTIIIMLLICVAGATTSIVILLNRHSLNISGAVVPHHNLVADQRADFFSDLAEHISVPKTIILLSPNHYYAGSGSIQTTDQKWQLSQGEISPDQNVISYLVKNNLAINEPPSFKNEHGIFNILSDIHNNFPKAKIVPIIFSAQGARLPDGQGPASGWKNKLKNLENGLRTSCANCLMIASVDFSHDQPALLAQQNDERSIAGLKARDTTDIIKNANIDSPPSLALLTMWAESHNTLSFILKNHTNAGAVTHVFGWYEAK